MLLNYLTALNSYSITSQRPYSVTCLRENPVSYDTIFKRNEGFLTRFCINMETFTFAKEILSIN